LLKFANGVDIMALALKLMNEMRLSELKPGERGRIKSFASSELELKLMEMGCIPGEMVVLEQVAPLGDPISIRVSGYSLSLRLNEADQILLDS
jgi:ferrous iron transport protein A